MHRPVAEAARHLSDGPEEPAEEEGTAAATTRGRGRGWRVRRDVRMSFLITRPSTWLSLSASLSLKKARILSLKAVSRSKKKPWAMYYPPSFRTRTTISLPPSRGGQDIQRRRREGGGARFLQSLSSPTRSQLLQLQNSPPLAPSPSSPP